MTTVVHGVQPREVEQLWPRLRPLVEHGLRYAGGYFGARDVQRSLIEGKRQLWIDWPDASCVLITERTDYPLRRVLHVFLVAGKLPDDWRAIWHGIERWAESEGCTVVEVRGRPGWARRLRGYKASMIFLSKELTA